MALPRIALIFLCFIASQAHALTLKIATVAPHGTRWMLAMREASAEIQRRAEGRRGSNSILRGDGQ